MPADVVEVSGWAWFAHDALTSCSVMIDGHVTASADLGPAPRDVVRSRPETAGSSRCGWSALVDLVDFSERDVVLGAIATSARGEVEYLSPVRVTVTPARRISRAAGIEKPGPGVTVPAGRVNIAGWALADGAHLGRLAVRVNGRDAGLARPFAAPRPDIAARRTEPCAPVAGFEHIITVDGEPGSRVRIEVELVTVDGNRAALVGVDARVASPPPLRPSGSRSEVIAALDDSPAAAVGGPLRVVVFTHNLVLGGSQLYLQELLRDLLKNADVSCLVVAGQDGPLRGELERLGAAVHVTDYPFPETVAYAARVVELAGLVRAFGARVVIVNTLIAAIGADVACRLDLPAVWAIHESYTLEDYWLVTHGDGVPPTLAAANAATLAETAVVLFEADATRDAYAKVVGGDRLATLHYGVDVEAIGLFARSVERADVRRMAGFDDEVVLVCVGTFEPRKGQAMLAAAFASVAEEFPRARLVLVGETETVYARGVRELVQRLGLGERIKLQALEPEPYRWYVAADGFVLPSDLESMPRVLLEAMAFGLPVVAANVWGIPELVRHGENGLLFAPRDLEALADALRNFLRLSPDARARLGAAGSRLVHDRHDGADYRRVFERLLRRLVADPRADVTKLLAP